MPNSQIKYELLELNAEKWRLFREQLPASHFGWNEKAHVSASESCDTETATKKLLENSPRSAQEPSLRSSSEAACAIGPPGLMGAVPEATGAPGEEGIRGLPLCGHEGSASTTVQRVCLPAHS